MNSKQQELFLMGNEAMARGLIEAGCTLASAYPGTPSTETIRCTSNGRSTKRSLSRSLWPTATPANARPWP